MIVARLSGAVGATREALIAAFCRLDKSLSCCWGKGWLVGAVGIELMSEALQDKIKNLDLPAQLLVYSARRHWNRGATLRLRNLTNYFLRLPIREDFLLTARESPFLPGDPAPTDGPGLSCLQKPF